VQPKFGGMSIALEVLLVWRICFQLYKWCLGWAGFKNSCSSVLRFSIEAHRFCITSCLHYVVETFFLSGEDEARQKLASCPKRMQEHRSTHAQRIQTKLPRAGGDIPSDRL
jgi:hypothetical protein